MAQRRKGGMAELPFAPMPRKRRQRRPSPSLPASPAVGPSTPQSDLFGVARTATRHVLTYLDTASLGLGIVNMRSLRGDDGPDGYLYHVTTRTELETIQARGTVLFSARAPLVLTERNGVPAWLADMMDTTEPDGGQGDAPVIFRVKRFAIDGLVENDPDRTRRYGVSFYLLTGVAGQD